MNCLCVFARTRARTYKCVRYTSTRTRVHIHEYTYASTRTRVHVHEHTYTSTRTRVALTHAHWKQTAAPPFAVTMCTLWQRDACRHRYKYTAIREDGHIPAHPRPDTNAESYFSFQQCNRIWKNFGNFENIKVRLF